MLFGYVDEAHLSTERRRQLQLHEIVGFNSDIVCLQEVDQRLFEQYLEPHMNCLGYSGRYLSKGGSVREVSHCRPNTLIIGPVLLQTPFSFTRALRYAQ